MYNGELLGDIIQRRGLKKKHIAAALGLSPYGFAKKVSGQNEFLASEIRTLTDELHLTASERDRIFFAKEVN